MQNLSFRKGLTHDFGAELRNFSLGCFLGKKFLTIKFLNILREKKRISRQRKLSKHNCKT